MRRHQRRCWPFACALLVTSALVVALIVSVASTPGSRSQPKRNPVAVTVEEDLTALPVGTSVHLCLASMPCQDDVVEQYSRKNTQVIALPLPAGLTARAADGWSLHAFATVRGRTYQDSVSAKYLVSVDPPCHCAGDFAYVRLGPAP